MTGVRRREAADFDVVAHQVVASRQVRHLAVKIFLLSVPAWPPAQDASDVQVFSKDMAHHGFRADAFRRAVIMRAASSMDVMIAGVPALLCDMNPALQIDGNGLLGLVRHCNVQSLRQIFGATIHDE